MVAIGIGLLAVGSAVMVVPAVASASVGSATLASATDDDVRELAERYAPRVVLRAQDGPCDPEGEQYAPTSVDVVLDNPQVLLRQVGVGNPVMARGPGAADLHDLGEGFYLDFPGDALSPGCTYEKDFARYSSGRPAVVYAHVVAQPDVPDLLALQYWFFWYYNDWNNKHEGDWEGIQLLFEAGTVAEALRGEPLGVGYAQHEGGEQAGWHDAKLERDGTHPVVYVSVGSHASYFGSALYLGRGASEGFGCDLTAGPSVTLRPDIVALPHAADDPADPLAWVDYEGRWGERRSGPYNGPTGPAQKARWTAPVDWHDDLRADSVVVPGGDSEAARLANVFCDVVEWGSGQLIALQQQPVVLVGAAVAAAVAAGVLLRRTDWTLVSHVPVVRRRRIGQILRAAARAYAAAPGRFLVVGLVYLPAAVVVGLVLSLLRLLPLVDALLALDGEVGVVGIVLTLVVGGVTHAIAFVIATSAIAVVMRDLEGGTTGAGRALLDETVRRGGDLAAGLVRAVAVVAVLLISVVGIPWGVRQLIRYQFLAQVTVLEGGRGRAALDRSAELVAGRWLHTAGAVIVFNGVASAIGTVVGLVLLVAVADVPLWLFSALVTVVAALVVPYAAAAAVLLYGDAAAERSGVGSAEATGPQRRHHGTVAP